MSTVKKTAKLRKIWTQTPEQAQDKALDLDVMSAELNAKADLNKSERKLHEQEQLVLNLKRKLESVISKPGESWSPAEIVNAEIDLEESEAVLKQLTKNNLRIKEIIKEYL